MTVREPRFIPLGESALTVEFGNVISESLNQRAINASRMIDEYGFPWLIETSPAYASVSVFFDPIAVHREFPGYDTCFDAVRAQLEPLIEKVGNERSADSRSFLIDVDFSRSFGPDLSHVATVNSLTEDDVIEIFTSVEYRVYMLGFLPGFTYMGEVDQRIETPRHETPRVSVDRGSVGIAGRQTGIYSLASPGGWQIIGRTDAEMFDAHRNAPSLLSPGDKVRFRAK